MLTAITWVGAPITSAAAIAFFIFISVTSYTYFGQRGPVHPGEAGCEPVFYLLFFFK